MSAEDAPKSAKVTQEEFDTIQNRIQLALAKHENLVKSWTVSSSRKEPTKTQEQLDAEDAALFRNEPPYLGVGAPIPSHFLVNDAERNNKTLRAKFFPTKGLKGSKPRDLEEKATSAKRALNDESSDEEGGRSSLGKAKKVKTMKAEPAVEQVKSEVKHKAGEDKIEPGDVKEGKSGVMKQGKVENTIGKSLATPPTTPEKNPDTITQTEQKTEELTKETEGSRPTTNQTEIREQEGQEGKEEEEEVTPSNSMNGDPLKLNRKKKSHKLRREKLKQRKKEELAKPGVKIA